MKLLRTNAWRRETKSSSLSLCLGVFLVLSLPGSQATVFWVAHLNISFQVGNETVWELSDNGVFGRNSPLKKVSGVVVPPDGPNQNACSPFTSFNKPVNVETWIALIMRGLCNFTNKIKVAAEKGVVGVIIYNYPGTGNGMFPMISLGAEDIVAVMIVSLKGLDILRLIQNGIRVTVEIEVGKHYGSWFNHYLGSLVICTLVTVAYFTFCCVGRLRTARTWIQRCQQLRDVKKAIGSLELRILKESDKEADSDGETCVVCLEAYKSKDVVRILQCSHFFHEKCIDPWLLQHRTCPVCKCDILQTKVMEAPVKNEAEPFSAVLPNEAPSNTSLNEEDNDNEYVLVRGTERPSVDE
ncbi:PREDICTED: RING finger protein 148-like [Crocodylus porosus]|uniref:RING finger protein 148-like n=1 Tax=Crocodylus porosus TaxID=8502 RepID=UPI00093AA20A|nr:PREDICTED: RING finger protein 148-like [Crocodylus porosus]